MKTQERANDPLSALSLQRQDNFNTQPQEQQMELQPGIYHGMSMADYQRINAISRSMLIDLLYNPYLYYQKYVEKIIPAKSNASTEFGSLAHTLILEPETFESLYQVVPDDYDGRKKDWRETKEQIAAEGKEPLKRSQFQHAMILAENIMDIPYLKHVENRDNNEVVVVTDLCGVRVKMRLDHVFEPLVVDVKTCSPNDFQWFEHNIKKWNLHVQGAFYLDGISQQMGRQFSYFLFAAAENQPPYSAQPFGLSQTKIEEGRELYQQALALYRQCVESNEWPGRVKELKII